MNNKKWYICYQNKLYEVDLSSKFTIAGIPVIKQ